MSDTDIKPEVPATASENKIVRKPTGASAAAELDCPLTVEQVGTLPDDDAYLHAAGIVVYPIPLGYKAVRSMKVPSTSATSDSSTPSPSTTTYNCSFEVKEGPSFVISVTTPVVGSAGADGSEVGGGVSSSANVTPTVGDAAVPPTPSSTRVYRAANPNMAWKVARSAHHLGGPHDGFTAFGLNRKSLTEALHQQAATAGIDVTAEVKKVALLSSGADDDDNNAIDTAPVVVATKGDDPLGGYKRLLQAEGKLLAMRRKVGAAGKREPAAGTAATTKKATAPRADKSAAAQKPSPAPAPKPTGKKSKAAAPNKCPLCKLGTPFCAVNGQRHQFETIPQPSTTAAEAAVAAVVAGATDEEASVAIVDAVASGEPNKRKGPAPKKAAGNKKTTATAATDLTMGSPSVEAIDADLSLPLAASTAELSASTTSTAAGNNKRKKKETATISETNDQKLTTSASAFVAPPPLPAPGDPVVMTRISRPKKSGTTVDAEDSNAAIAVSESPVKGDDIEAAAEERDETPKRKVTKAAGAKRASSGTVAVDTPTPKKKGARVEKSVSPPNSTTTTNTTKANKAASPTKLSSPTSGFSLAEDESSVAVLPPPPSTTTKATTAAKRARSTSKKEAPTAAASNASTKDEPAVKKERKERPAATVKTSIVTREVVEADGTVTTIIEEVVTPIVPKAPKPPKEEAGEKAKKEAKVKTEIVELDGNPISAAAPRKRQIQTKLSFGKVEEVPSIGPDGKPVLDAEGKPVMVPKTLQMPPPPPPPALRAPFNKVQTKLAYDVFMKRGGLHSEEQLKTMGIVAAAQKLRFMRFIFHYTSERCRAEVVRQMLNENDGELPDEFKGGSSSAAAAGGSGTVKKTTKKAEAANSTTATTTTDSTSNNDDNVAAATTADVTAPAA